MTKRKIKDVGASVRAKLAVRARERREDFQLVVTRFVTERVLYRLASSTHRDRFILKGATLFTLWSNNPYRTTRDMDLLGYGDSSPASVASVLREILELPVDDDGVRFDVGSLRAGLIRQEQEYGGVRVTFDASVGGAKVGMQIDVGFGDAVTPSAELVDFPTILGHAAPRIRVYPKETVIAEKLEAIVNLGVANSRMKDFYDLVTLSRTFELEGAAVLAAIRATFANRNTELPRDTPVGLSDTFASDASKSQQWTAFLRKANGEAIGSLADAIAEVRLFVEAPLRAAEKNVELTQRWAPSRGWFRDA